MPALMNHMTGKAIRIKLQFKERSKLSFEVY